MAKDYYALLGLTKTSTKKQIKKAYKKLANQYHPDKNPNNPQAEEKFKDIKLAYETLYDEEKRREYDLYGEEGSSNHRQRREYQSQGFRQQHHNSANGFSQFDFSDLFGHGFDRQNSRQQQQKGSNLEFNLHIYLLDSLQGATKVINIPINNQNKTIKVKIPKGIKSGGKIRYAGKGEPGFNQGQSGDLIIHITVDDDATLSRNGDDLTYKKTIDMFTAVLGGEINISLLDKNYKLKIPSTTQNGKKFKLKNKGIATKEGQFGDLYVEINISIPKLETEEQKALITQLQDLLNK
ncbi:J domain-containing protein [Vibrio sp. SS-MA-C1-2]|uniref:DnaJ C-terminal domain-containing protein n=1 Tax=Vibrio sp. SS-MA-C1-2 TaxID=2908646 RepID=UPI001F23C494|nr:J domain-containing protein [Vibrio sp. SS-MA-C1-2]UJF16997.1 J domain-containing protein [Vibrio sp. SS-MA-C1-2]